MNRVQSINRFIQAAHQRRGAVAKIVTPSMHQPFVTISRQAGAGGHLLAEALVAELSARASAEATPLGQDWLMLDKELCGIIAADKSMNANIEELSQDTYHSQLDDFWASMFGDTPQDDVYRKMAGCMRSLAAAGHVILVGRGANFVTRDLINGVHVHVVGSESSCIERMMGAFHLTPSEAKRWMGEQNDSRDAFIKHYFDTDRQDPRHYDLVINTDHVEAPEAARLIVDILEKRCKQESAA